MVEATVILWSRIVTDGEPGVGGLSARGCRPAPILDLEKLIFAYLPRHGPEFYKGASRRHYLIRKVQYWHYAE